MSRIEGTLLNKAYSRIVNGRQQPMLNLSYGGWHGYSPNMEDWVSNAAYISRPTTCIVLEAPKIFNLFEDSKTWNQCFKALMEVHPIAFDGLSSGLEVEFDDHPVGGAGEVQHEVKNVTRKQSTPKFTYVDKYGRPIQIFLDFLIRYGMMDPETKFALIGTLANKSKRPTDWLADQFTATCLFFEPDPLNRTINKAWLCTNMMPKSNGDILGKRDLTQAQEKNTLDIEWTAITSVSAGVYALAQEVLDAININHSDPFMRAAPTWAKISEDMKTEVAARGYEASADYTLADPKGTVDAIEQSGA